MKKETGTTKLVRARFGPGMLLQHQDLELLNSYTQNLSRLMFRSLFGCGVVCGLDVKFQPDCGKWFITVNSGVAIACSGDPIWVPETKKFAPSDQCDTDLDSPLWVVLCRTEKCCGPRTSVCDSDDGEASSICTRVVEGYEIRVETSHDCYCGCTDAAPTLGTSSGVVSDCRCADPNSPCYKDHYDGVCGCKCGECSDCDCDCVLLARLTKDGEEWTIDHSPRRFVRPVLISDPKVRRERDAKLAEEKEDDEAKQAEIMHKQTADNLKKAEAWLLNETRENNRLKGRITEMEKKLDTLLAASKKKSPKVPGSKPATAPDPNA